MKQLSFVFSPSAKKRRIDGRDRLRTFLLSEVDCVTEVTPSGGIRRRRLPFDKARAAARYAGTGIVIGL